MLNEHDKYETNLKMKGDMHTAAGIIGGALTGNAVQQQVCRASLTERIRERQMRAQSERGREERLAELSYLLEKNPDVARILDLLDIDVRL